MEVADSIDGLLRRCEALDDESRADVSRVLLIEETWGAQEVPEALRAKCTRWCGGGDDAESTAWRKAERQLVITVHSIWTFETCNINILRACRPLPPASHVASTSEVMEACSGPLRCDFCDVENLTCVEPFGRICGKHSQTAGNVFKTAGAHGLIVWKQHDPLKLTDEDLLDGLDTADKWFHAAATSLAQNERHTSVPVLFWNCFLPSGASQLHPHMQVQFFSRPIGRAAMLHSQCMRYRESEQGNGRDLCRDLALAHQRLGLALELGDGVICWASLCSAVGGGELCALGPGTSGNPQLFALGRAFVAMLRATRRCGSDAHSFFVSKVVAEGGTEAWLFRCLGRGKAMATVFDSGASELNGVSGVSTDPYKLIAALREEVVGAKC
eukprot:TRINITY_DN71560_c0_g1_i1.p1 TRINITY_DN71560_c0_g1~~TRINITY_DN71560_c0_g1_i1.p1  ORF type:complete len:424 (-),score=62.17 TRINITY_DN71560_c0_g1_i1:55-1209(-)